MMHKVKSCGTVVFAQNHQQTYHFLLIKHQKTLHWGFPKGHQEHSEKHVETALRETKEEVGLDVKLYHHIKDQITYHPNASTEKTVIYYLAHAEDYHFEVQTEEVIEARWLTYDAVIKTLTYDSDKHAFISIIHQAQKKHVFLNPQLIRYIEDQILPMYASLDQAHRVDHVKKVQKEAMELARHHDVYHHMVYVIASFHDVGMIHGREDHHIKGGDMLASDRMLPHWFKDEEIYVMKQAVIDHRASQKNPPKTIYGQIIAQADRDLDLEAIIRRIVLYGKDRHPDLKFDEFFEEGYRHLQEKYGKDGYMTIWIKTDETVQKIREMQNKILNKSAIFEQFYNLFHQN